MYEELTLIVPEKLLKRKAAERAVSQYFPVYVDRLGSSQKVPFTKPIASYCMSMEYPHWDGLLTFIDKENSNFKSALEKSIQCTKHHYDFHQRTHNFTNTYGCIKYLNGECSEGFTYYKNETMALLNILESGCSVDTLNNLLNFIKCNGPNGCPDFIALRDKVLMFVEVKTLHEKFSSENQEKYLSWCTQNGGRGILLSVIEGYVLELK
jgi:hypothetical protein